MEPYSESTKEQKNAPKPKIDELEQESGGLIEVEKARAQSDLKDQITLAVARPRDWNKAITQIASHCSRFSFAERSMYRYPRAGEIIEGLSIRAAEMLAQAAGNLRFGVRELESGPGWSLVQAYCIDVETNVAQEKTFKVKLERKAKGKIVRLSDPRDCYEHTANNGARRLRACILGLIPFDIQEDVVRTIKQTLAKGRGNETIEDRLKKMVLAFKELGVLSEHIEAYLGHELAATTVDEIVELHGVFSAIKDGVAKRADFFKAFEKEDRTKEGKAGELNERILGKKEKKEESKNAN